MGFDVFDGTAEAVLPGGATSVAQMDFDVFDATTEVVLPKQFKIVLTTYLQNVKIFAGRKMKNDVILDKNELELLEELEPERLSLKFKFLVSL